MKLIERLEKRKAFFDGWETANATYPLICAQCRKTNIIVFKEILDAAWGWQEGAEDETQVIASTFGIDLNNKWIGDGMSAVVVKVCAECGKKHYVFFWFHEYQNSCYEISLRASAEN